MSTIYSNDNNEHVQLTQGKSILMSHDIGGQRKQGIGFWGVKEKCQPIVGVSEYVSEWINRSNNSSDLAISKGTKLSILCFDTQKSWQEHLAVSVAENFFAAISDGKLRVEIDNKYELDQKTISQLFNDDKATKIKSLISDQKNEPEQFDNCNDYLSAHQGGIEVIVEESQRKTLGLCQLRILVGENLPKKVCILRNGMFITDNLSGLKSFSDFKDFVAVFHCQDKIGNALLRAMEPPRHDDFEVNLLPTKEEQIKGKKALKEISDWVRECLKRHAKDPVSDVTEIDELKDFFGDEGDSDTGKGTEEINPYGNVIIRGKPIKTRLQATEQSGQDAEAGDDLGEKGGRSDVGTGTGNGNGEVGSDEGSSGGVSQKSLVQINNVRATLSGSKSRKISFTPTMLGKIILNVKQAGADSDYDVLIIKAESGEIKNGGLVLEAVVGQRISLNIELNQEYPGALKVMAYEI